MSLAQRENQFYNNENTLMNNNNNNKSFSNHKNECIEWTRNTF